MKKFLPYLLVFIFGAFATYLFLKPKSAETAEATSSQLISYELKKLNKMIVLEEKYTYQQAFEGSLLPKSWLDEYNFLKRLDHKKVVVLAKGTSQVSYDMKKLKIDVNNKDKTLTITSLPKPQFELFTDVDFLNLDTGVVNSVDAKELNHYKDYVNKKIEDQIDEKALEKKAHQQLVENLSDLFVLAKALNYKIVDKTNISTEVNSFLDRL